MKQNRRQVEKVFQEERTCKSMNKPGGFWNLSRGP